MAKYQIIYADPPWNFSSRGVRSGRFADLDYPKMTMDEICRLPVRTIADTDAALFLWVPSAFIMEAGRVMEAWGFKYIRVDSVWVKKKKSSGKHAVCGPWGMNDAEYLLMGVRGQMCALQKGKRNLYTVIPAIYPGIHSGKPDIFRRRIVRRFGNLSRIELFAREHPAGWAVWGDEVESQIKLQEQA